jgi:hypothetical protein
MSVWLAGLVPVISALLGLGAGLVSPVIATRSGRSDRRRDAERGVCDQILSMFQDVNALENLKNPQGTTRRRLLLLAVRIGDQGARETCTELVEFASSSDATDDGILDRWTHMVSEIARVYRETS